MVTAKNAGFSAASQQRVEQGAQQTALGEAFAQAADWGTQALAMQQSLLAGLVRSQGLEARRLAALYTPDDERVAAAAARGARYAGMQAEVLERAQQIGNVIDTFQKDGLFTGYVLQTDGTPAVGYGVLLRIGSSSTRKGAGGKATTDASGWFSIDTGIAPAPTPGTTTGTRPVDGVVDKPILLHVERLVDRLMSELPDHQVATPAPTSPPANGTPTASAPPPPSSEVASDVTVTDPTGRVVFEDPMPPTFVETASEFRVYTLFSQSGLAPSGVKRKG